MYRLPFLKLKGKTVFSGGEKHFRRRQNAALKTEKLTGAGKGRLPGDFEIPAQKAVRSLVWDIRFRASGIADHLYLTV